MKTQQKVSQPTHTPTPWKITHEDLRSDDHRNRPHIWGEGNVIAICHTTEDEFLSAEQMRANAAFIVRAVNSHEALLQALKDLASEINLSKLNVRKDFHLMNVHACALKAIAQASEGKV